MASKQNAGLNGCSRLTPAAIRGLLYGNLLSGTLRANPQAATASVSAAARGRGAYAGFAWKEDFEAEEIDKPISPVNRLADSTD